ncbi:MAG: site-specific integrase, partial [Candidatus Omnitrophica bacterium]|nr:site-specific integrase [Candidatus Omnitrophota bacterium]
MAKKPIKTKVGIVTIQEQGPGRWKLRYRNPGSGEDVRKVLSDISQSEALRIAAHLSQEALARGGYIPGRKTAVPTVREAFKEAIKLTRRRDYVKRETARHGTKFIKWLAEHHPRVKQFDDLKPGFVKEYVRELEAEGKAWNTVRLALAPIHITWRYMAENYPEDVRPLPRIRLSPAPPKKVECLDPLEVVALLGWLKANRPNLFGMAALQVLAGLRMFEAAALRRKDIDLKRGLVTVTETPTHKPKTATSYRTIPICREVRDILADIVDNQTVLSMEGEIFLTRKGNPYGKNALISLWRRALPSAAKKTKIKRLKEVPPHRLRSSFATMAASLGVEDRILKSYLGHAPTDMLGA